VSIDKFGILPRWHALKAATARRRCPRRQARKVENIEICETERKGNNNAIAEARAQANQLFSSPDYEHERAGNRQAAAQLARGRAAHIAVRDCTCKLYSVLSRDGWTACKMKKWLVGLPSRIMRVGFETFD